MYPRVSAWGSRSEKVSYEYREPTNFKESFINLSSIFADDPEHPRSQQTSIEGVQIGRAHV